MFLGRKYVLFCVYLWTAGPRCVRMAENELRVVTRGGEKKMKRFLVLFVLMANIMGVCTASANADSKVKKYHLDQYPGVGGLLHWGMSVQEIEKVLNQPVADIGQNKYQASFLSGALKLNAVCVVADRGLEAVVLQFDILPEEYSRLVDRLKDLYGAPSGVDSEMRAIQWKDGLNDTGIAIMGEKDGVYSALVGLRWLRDPVAITGLEPGKISSLEGVQLGMPREEFFGQYKHFKVEKLPPEGDMPVNAEVYKAPLTVNLRPAEAFFEFTQGRLTFIMIYVPVRPDDGDFEKGLNDHLGFLSGLYGSPSEESPNMVTWNDGVQELRLGLHPLGEFVISWEFLESL